MARHKDPATLVAIFSNGSVTIGTPDHNTSVPVVCALHRGLQELKNHYISKIWNENLGINLKGLFIRVKD